MAGGNPIVLGSAAQDVLVPDPQSKIQTDDHGIQRGTIRYQLGDQGEAQRLRPIEGAPYTGALPQFRGFLVDYAGDVIGGEGKTAFVDVTYAALDPRGNILPQRSSDLEYRPLSEFGILAFNVKPEPVPIPHPLVTVKFADKKPQNKLGAVETPSFMPTIDKYLYPIYAITGGTIDNSAGKLEVTSFQVTAVFKLVFIPAPQGWVCLKDDAIPVCGGKLFSIEQQWKRFYWFAGFEK